MGNIKSNLFEILTGHLTFMPFTCKYWNDSLVAKEDVAVYFL